METMVVIQTSRRSKVVLAEGSMVLGNMAVLQRTWGNKYARPRKLGGSGRDHKSGCILCCCLVWEGQIDRQHGDQHMKESFGSHTRASFVCELHFGCLTNFFFSLFIQLL